MEISQSVLKDKYPELYREDIYPVIDQGDFRLKDLEWTSDNRVKFAPDYIDPEDLFYEVTLYYEKWHEDKFKKNIYCYNIHC